MSKSAVVVAVIVISVLEAMTVALFHAARARSSQTALLLGEIHIKANRLDALEWKAMARRGMPPEIIDEVAAVRGEMDECMRRLAETADAGSHAGAIRQFYESYAKAMDKEFAHLKRGEWESAQWHDERRVEPAFVNLKMLLARCRADAAARAATSEAWDSWGTFTSLALATGAILVLLKHFLTAQQYLAQAQADKRVMEEYERSAAEIRKLNDALEVRIQERTAALRQANQRLEGEIKTREHLESMVQQVSEQEKLRLGQDLHDGLGQVLTGAAMRSKALEGRLRALALPEAEHLSQVTALIAEGLQMTRSLAGVLYPVELERAGLVSAIQGLAVKLHRQSGVPCTVAGGDDLNLSGNGADIHLYRIAQEAVTNAIRHGAPTRILIRLSRNQGQVQLEVENDGPRLQQTSGLFDGMGCRIMKYRADVIGATLQFMALETGGCVVRCCCPTGA